MILRKRDKMLMNFQRGRCKAKGKTYYCHHVRYEYKSTYPLLPVALRTSSVLVCLIFDVSRSHKIRHTHPLGLLCKRDRTVAEAATYAAQYKHKTRTSIPSAGFETATPRNREAVMLGFRRHGQRNRQADPY
jgi:hypothetical protein